MCPIIELPCINRLADHKMPVYNRKENCCFHFVHSRLVAPLLGIDTMIVDVSWDKKTIDDDYLVSVGSFGIKTLIDLSAQVASAATEWLNLCDW